VDGEHGPVNGVDVLELFAHQPKRQVVEAVAAVSLRKAHSWQADRGELGEDLGIVAAFPVVGLNVRRELAGAEIVHRGHKLLLVLGQREVEHYFFGVGEGLTFGVGDGDGDASGLRSPGPTRPITGRWSPTARMTGTEWELWSCGCKKSM
jgi:hypothetical protein